MVAWGDECARRSVKTSSPSFELQAVAVSDACVRISLICASVKTRAFFKALSMAFISSRCARRSLSSCFQSAVVTWPMVSFEKLARNECAAFAGCKWRSAQPSLSVGARIYAIH